MYFRMAKRLLLETDKRLLWKLAWNAGYKGIRSIRQHRAAAEEGRVLSAVPVHLDHQQLQSAVPGLLGRRGGQAGEDRSARHAPADQRIA